MKPPQSSARSAASATVSAVREAESLSPPSVRREHQRFTVDLQVNVGSEHNFYAGLAENLSVGGLFVATHRLEKVGARIELSLSMPDCPEPFELVGEVRWVRSYNESSDTPPGFGIRFVEIPSGAAEAIARFLGQREPLFFDDD